MKTDHSKFFGTFIIAIAITSFFGAWSSAEDPLPKLILDADTANEIDDQYAIIRMFKQNKFDVIGLTSAQWFHCKRPRARCFGSALTSVF